MAVPLELVSLCYLSGIGNERSNKVGTGLTIPENSEVIGEWLKEFETPISGHTFAGTVGAQSFIADSNTLRFNRPTRTYKVPHPFTTIEKPLASDGNQIFAATTEGIYDIHRDKYIQKCDLSFLGLGPCIDSKALFLAKRETPDMLEIIEYSGTPIALVQMSEPILDVLVASSLRYLVVGVERIFDLHAQDGEWTSVNSFPKPLLTFYSLHTNLSLTSSDGRVSGVQVQQFCLESGELTSSPILEQRGLRELIAVGENVLLFDKDSVSKISSPGLVSQIRTFPGETIIDECCIESHGLLNIFIVTQSSLTEFGIHCLFVSGKSVSLGKFESDLPPMIHPSVDGLHVILRFRDRIRTFRHVYHDGSKRQDDSTFKD